MWSLVAESHNDLHRHEGHSPFEAMLGRTPKPLDTDLLANEPEVPLLNPSQRIAAHQERRRACRRAYEETQASQRIRAAVLHKARSTKEYYTAELVWFWRKTKVTSNQSRGKFTGSWRGPGIVLFHQKQMDRNDGSITPTGVVWVISGGRLLRIAPQHLKIASEADRRLFEIANGPVRNLTESLSHVYPNEAEDLTRQAGPAPEEEEQQGVIDPWHPGVQRLLELNPDLLDTTSTAGPASAAGPTEEIV